MNWDAIAAIGQMLGSVAVLVTLAYVAAQVHQARRETRRGLSQGRAEAVRHLRNLRITYHIWPNGCIVARLVAGEG